MFGRPTVLGPKWAFPRCRISEAARDAAIHLNVGRRVVQADIDAAVELQIGVTFVLPGGGEIERICRVSRYLQHR